MAITKTWENGETLELLLQEETRASGRRKEFIFLCGASLLALCGLLLVYLAKARSTGGEQQQGEHGSIVNINAVRHPAELIPALNSTVPGKQAETAEQLFEFIQHHWPLPNVGALSRLRDVEGKHSLIPLARTKPFLIVRTPQEFQQAFIKWCSLYLLAFWAVHFLYRWRGLQSDQALLPAIHLLTAMGLIAMLSLRDPLRDILEFKKFVLGVLLGCAILLLPLLKAFDYRRFSGLIYTPLFGALALFVAVWRFGSGPAGSDAKVNLGPFQPVELIKLLLVFFMAGYFAREWEKLRDLRQRTLVPHFLSLLKLPRIRHALPVMSATTCALFFFFLLKDMGPALVIGILFLVAFAVARGKTGLAMTGLLLLIAGVAIGYHIGVPHTVADRVTMWLSPWDNNVRGGDQLAQSLWAFATGGSWGSGPGYGDPSVIPAGHTDLILASIAEEWGIGGVLAIAALFALLVHKALRISSQAPDEYGFFLALSLGVLLALEMLLISGGALGAIPLSGVVSPFLSLGNTAMLANFAICAVLLNISQGSAKTYAASSAVDDKIMPIGAVFRLPTRTTAWTLGLCALLLVGRAVYLQLLRGPELIAETTLVFTQDGVKRPLRNPRLNLLAATIPRGSIFDRNGIVLATSNRDLLEKQRDQIAKLNTSLHNSCSPPSTRCYPFGPATIHLLGDWRTGENFHASNSSLIEHDSNTKLQGYKNYRELAPFIRYRHQPENPALQSLLNRDRDVHTTIDIRLQWKAAEILRNRLERTRKKGAIVVMDPGNGDILALASWPAPADLAVSTPDELLDRARYGQYPPGSTFKLVTAMAALRLNPAAATRTYSCQRLGDGRAGTVIKGWRRPIRDDIGDHPHGTLNLASAISVSCNAYFAQLGVNDVGSKCLKETAELLQVQTGELKDLRQMLPFAAYGQGPVLTTPFKMARIAATVAANGLMPEGRWVGDESNSRTAAGRRVISPDAANFLAAAMRSVVVKGTARTAMNGLDISIAGKTGTAQLDAGEPHSWFAGFAPYPAEPGGSPQPQIAFAVVVEHGGYGAQVAAPIARELVEAAQQLGVIMNHPSSGR
jgi:cell division protein FtsI/penicillin-binding protein 2/cell division protein FtsW (lipid II flippase)